MLKKRFIKQLDAELSPLGLGTLRFRRNRDGSFFEEAFRIIEFAMAQGINCYDTAYHYISGHSEAFLHEALVMKYARESYVISDKLPILLCNSRDDMERIFQEQLERLGVEYIDIYLLHAMNKSKWLHANKCGVLDFLEEKKREGRIRKTGFSFHDKAGNLPIIVEAYDWDTIMLPINYYDWIINNVKRKYE